MVSAPSAGERPLDADYHAIAKQRLEGAYPAITPAAFPDPVHVRR
jgi:hypothetical protein